ncbi:hypothetical protein ACTWPB_12335 [Nocardia sp. IBHARD005]|uniref:hypothetical protein n=1 Tax=Nocardia sp. IBHARD005 TaxID=3457765 RepID=UPI00405A2323
MMPAYPPQQPANTLSATRSAFISITLRWWLLLVATVACVPLIWFMLNAPEPSSQVGRTTGQFVVTAAFLMLICFGPMAPVGVWIAERRRRALRQPWTCWQIQYQRGNYEHVTLIDEQGRKVQTHMLNTWPAMRGRLFDESTTQVWFAGDPLRRGVLSRPGGADLRYCWASIPTSDEVRATLARSAPRDHTPQSSPMTTHKETPTNESPAMITANIPGGYNELPLSMDRQLPKAWSTPRTLWTLTWTTFRALLVLVLGLACGTMYLHFNDVANSTERTAPYWADPAAKVAFLSFLAVAITGLAMVRTSVRRWLAAPHRWQIWRIESYRPAAKEWVHLIDDQGSITATLLLGKSSSRAFDIEDRFVWFAGDPNKVGLIAKPGGARSRLAYRSATHTPPPFGRAVTPPIPDLTPPSEPLPSVAPHGCTPEHDGGHTATRTPRGHPQSQLFGGLDDDRFPSPRKLR